MGFDFWGSGRFRFIFLGTFFLALRGFSLTLDYVDSVVLKEPTNFEGSKIGGLSGLAHHGELYWAVSDDKGQFGDPRIYGFEVKFSDRGLSIQPQKMIRLKDQKSQLLSGKTLDFEGLAWGDKTWIISNEGLFHLKPKVQPSLVRFSEAGGFLGEIPLPGEFLVNPSGKPKKGVRSNGAMEGLSLSPNGQFLFVAAEQPLIGDNKSWKQGQPGLIRLLRYHKVGESWLLDGSLFYPLEAVPAKSESTFPIVLGQGCSEILALSDHEILFLERGVWTTGTQINYEIKLYLVNLKEVSLNAPTPLKKTMVFDFATIKDKISDGKGLDNLEGLAFGPPYKGSQTLLFVSDDNFKSLQRTLWVALKMNLQP